jgi:hypothetical protein
MSIRTAIYCSTYSVYCLCFKILYVRTYVPSQKLIDITSEMAAAAASKQQVQKISMVVIGDTGVGEYSGD